MAGNACFLLLSIALFVCATNGFPSQAAKKRNGSVKDVVNVNNGDVVVDLNDRIVGGIEAVRHDWPWAVSVTTANTIICKNLTFQNYRDCKRKGRRGGFDRWDCIEAGYYPKWWDPILVVDFSGRRRHFCGGSLIGNKTVLTAAHCVEQDECVTVVVDEYDRTNKTDHQIEIFAIATRHPQYNERTMDNDFALLKLKSPVENLAGNAKVGTISLQTVEVAEGTVCKSAGWGTTSAGGALSTTLLEVDLPIIARENCYAEYPGYVTDNMICAGVEMGGKDSCQGDSGGPFICPDPSSTASPPVYKLSGVVSWGIGCGDIGNPGVYSNVVKAVDWITSNMS